MYAAEDGTLVLNTTQQFNYSAADQVVRFDATGLASYDGVTIGSTSVTGVSSPPPQGVAERSVQYADNGDWYGVGLQGSLDSFTAAPVSTALTPWNVTTERKTQASDPALKLVGLTDIWDPNCSSLNPCRRIFYRLKRADDSSPLANYTVNEFQTDITETPPNNNGYSEDRTGNQFDDVLTPFTDLDCPLYPITLGCDKATRTQQTFGYFLTNGKHYLVLKIERTLPDVPRASYARPLSRFTSNEAVNLGSAPKEISGSSIRLTWGSGRKPGVLCFHVPATERNLDEGHCESSGSDPCSLFLDCVRRGLQTNAKGQVSIA